MTSRTKDFNTPRRSVDYGFPGAQLARATSSRAVGQQLRDGAAEKAAAGDGGQFARDVPADGGVSGGMWMEDGDKEVCLVAV